MIPYAALTRLDDSVEPLLELLVGRRRVLIWGEMGVGKSTLAVDLLRAVRRGSACQLLELDPGSPPGGLPGAVCRLWWQDDALRWEDCQGLCTFDAARFRLPLLQAARRLALCCREAKLLLVDPPGVVRGVGAAELLMGLIDILAIDCIVALHREDEIPPLPVELAAQKAAVISVTAHVGAIKHSSKRRLDRRTQAWDRFIALAHPHTISLDDIPVLGTPPPREASGAWAGRQIALLDRNGATLAMGEIVELQGAMLTLRTRVTNPFPCTIAAAVVRDAGRAADGGMATVPHRLPPAQRLRQPVEMGPPLTTFAVASPPVSSQTGPAWATLVGGVFGDPLLHVRLRHHKISFFFDLGDSSRLMAKMAHQVRCIFLSHCHIDHIGGFLWFLRSRIGDFPPCRIFGPVDTIARLQSFLAAITWDRIEESGPVFEVGEMDGANLRRARLQPGKAPSPLPDVAVDGGLIVSTAEYEVRAAVLDHHIPSLAYALTFRQEIKVRKDRLEQTGLPPGPWLGKLKRAVAAADMQAIIELPDGTSRGTDALAADLLIIQPGRKLCYATDLADSTDNRRLLLELARGAHTLFCETAFAACDADKARATQHLTTAAALQIARAAGVERLVPFHFSRRYERNPQALYQELLALAGPVHILMAEEHRR